MKEMKLRLAEGKGNVSPMIYGQFIEQLGDCVHGGVYDENSALSDENNIRLDVMEKVKKLSPPVIRFPGGTVMCIYHWQDAVGPIHERKQKKNIIWGGVLRPEFGTAEFVAYCRRVGAEPMLCVNMASGTPEEAGAWVEYCNGTEDTYYANLRRQHGFEEPFNVKYWCIGNECASEPDIGIQHDVNIYIRDAKEFIKFMKLNDPTIQTLVVGCDDTENWNKPVLDGLQAFTDYLSYHFYAFDHDSLYGPFKSEKTYLDKIRELGELADSYPETVENYNPWYRFPPRQGKIKLAVDEWNIWNVRDDGMYGLHMTYNWRDAVWAASVMNHFIADEHIGMCNMAQLVNILAPIMADKDGCHEQTIFAPCEKYRHVMYGERLRCTLDGQYQVGDDAIDALSVSAVRRDGKVRIAIANRDFENDVAVVMPVSGEGIVLSADAPFAVSTRTENCVHEANIACTAGEQMIVPKGAVCIVEEK